MKSVLVYFLIVFIPGPDPYRKCGSGSGRLPTVVPVPDPGCHCSLTVSVPVSHSPCPSGVFVVGLILIMIVLFKNCFWKFFLKIIINNFFYSFLLVPVPSDSILLYEGMALTS